LNWLESAGLDVKVTQIVFHEADQPDAVGHLFDADQLAGEHGADVNFAPFVEDATAVRDERRSIMKRIGPFRAPPVEKLGFSINFT
jgi:hypothetical protein